MNETNRTPEIIDPPNVALQDYAVGLVSLLDTLGDDHMGFPGKRVKIDIDDDETRLVSMGVTEPYPKKSPRFGAIMSGGITKEQHLVVSDTTSDDHSSSQSLGYAVTNVRNDEPSKLFVSKHPGHPETWKEVDENSEDYADHLAAFLGLTETVVESIFSDGESRVRDYTIRRQQIEQEITDEEKELPKFVAESTKRTEKAAKAIDIDPDEVDDLYADQNRLLELIDKLDRKKYPTSPLGTKKPRGERLPRRHHKIVAADIAQTLETSYGVRVKRGKVAREVIERALEDRNKLFTVKVNRDGFRADADHKAETIARKKAHAQRLGALSTEATTKLDDAKSLLSK